ncbi:MAG: alpha/beta hydrolase [Chloroflexi bacterium]|nr:alpha/beta hydrolase [Chloroflexota bacterium]
MDDSLTFALIHSPLVGPFTWQLVRDELLKRHIDALVPELIDRPGSTQPYWQQHARSVAEGLAQVPRDRRIVLVAHSGAGPLLPVIRQALPHSIRAYVFVDAGLPRDGLSRLELMKLQDQAWADEFHQSLLQGGRFPDWTTDDLRAIIPDEAVRRQLVADLRPRSLPFFTEPIPAFDGWPDAPCVYLKLSAPYTWDAQQARQSGWPVREINAGHFHMLVDSAAVADGIINAL